MTIRRRVFVSNILMLVIPVFLSLLIVSVMLLAFIGILGIRPDNWFMDRERFFGAAEMLKSSSDKWEKNDDMRQMETDIDKIRVKYGKNKLSLAVYRDTELLYTTGDFDGSQIIVATALGEPGGNFYTMNDVFIYTQDAGIYMIVLMDSDYQLYGFNNHEKRGGFYFIGFLLTAVVIAMILATNRFLTRNVYKSIITPLDTLVYGVHQIRDGNLGYRITYTGKDEFSGICSDFNEMAGRLMDMVNARQLDEKNRKELIAGISHDLRTPLTSIMTYVEGIELGMASTPQTQKRYFDTIKNKSKDLEHIINQLFLFSKLDIGEFPMQAERTDAGQWLSDFIAGVSDEYGQKGLTINLEENVHGVEFFADSVQLRNVFINILENSLKYGNKDCQIMSVTCRKDNGNVIITMTDNGPGVPDSDLEMLFDVFYRADKARSNTSQGSGLGLAISEKIVERLDGSIKAANSPEGGLSITVTLPIIKSGAPYEKRLDTNLM